MKKIFLQLLVLLSLQSYSQTNNLPVEWKFINGDNPSYKNENYDDNAWQKINITDTEKPLPITEGHTFGWYRVAFDVPTNKREEDLFFLLGEVDDCDETFINGVLVGSSGKMPPNDQTAWDVQRAYLVKKENLKAHNVLAIRVFNAGASGGISSSSCTYTTQPCFVTEKGYKDLFKKVLDDKRSYHQLTTSNGLISAVYNFKKDCIEAVYPHIFSAYVSAKFVQPFLTNLRIKSGEKPIGVKYLDNTHIIEVQYKNFVIDYFAPFTTHEKVFYAVVKGKNKFIRKVSFQIEKDSSNITPRGNLPTDFDNRRIFLFTFKYDLEYKKTTLLGHVFSSKRDEVLEEIKYMKSVFVNCHLPKNLTKTERDLAEQSVSILKMSQVGEDEIFPAARGQILASLRPGVWAISWVRDAAFSIQAMSAVGMYSEAKKGLEFMLKATPTDQYVKYIHTDGKDYGIGVPYQISVTRYFGNGREESDFGDTNGPNIEIDDFGLFLTAFADYVNQSKDSTFYKKWRDVVLNKVVKAIIHNIDTNDLIRRESGPWEHHLPGRQFLFTSAVCAKGLLAISELENDEYLLNISKNIPNLIISDSLAYLGIRLLNGIVKNNLIEKKFLKGNQQDKNPSDHYYYDGATFEIFANGLIDDVRLFKSHMKEYDKQLRVNKNPDKGYMRFNSDDSYENQEWPFANLRVAIAQNKFGNKAEAKKLLDRITYLASFNYNQIPEIISNDLEKYKGAIPMVGYGAGAYLLALLKIKN